MTLLFAFIRKSPLFAKKALEQLLSAWSSFLHVVFSLWSGVPTLGYLVRAVFFCSWCPHIMAASCTPENYGEEESTGTGGANGPEGRPLAFASTLIALSNETCAPSQEDAVCP